MGKSQKKLQYASPATLSFALLSLLALVLDKITFGFTTNLLFCTYRSSLTDPFTYLRLFGHVLGHADLAHYSGNMVLFLVLGPILEEKYGKAAFIKMIALTALVSGLFYMIFLPHSALLGASGIVFMMIVLSSSAGLNEGKIPITMILVIIIYLGGEIFDGFTLSDGIAQGAHIVGGLCGAAFGFMKANSKYA
ncbi:MAG: rhomboid family intramembrane serine protease [Anaerocolumna sp.]